MTEGLTTFSRAVRPGTKLDWDEKPMHVWIEIRWNGTRLSICGVEGPKRNGDARGSCGQCRDCLNDLTPAPGWTAEMVARLAEVWDRWHLNDMNAGTPRQMERLRALRYDRQRDGDHYDWAKRELARAGLQPDVIGTKQWTAEDCPGRPCSDECDHVETLTYSYGSAWLHEDVPADVIEFLRGLPDADREYPWTLMHN